MLKSHQMSLEHKNEYKRQKVGDMAFSLGEPCTVL